MKNFRKDNIKHADKASNIVRHARTVLNGGPVTFKVAGFPLEPATVCLKPGLE